MSDKLKGIPLADRILVKRDSAETKSRGGIIIPDHSKEKPLIGTVVACGPGRHNNQGQLIEMHVKEGDRILFSKYGGTDVKLGDEDLLILKQDDVLLKVVEINS